MITTCFLFTLIGMFMAVFAHIYLRGDIGGWAKGWVLPIFLVPLLRILMYPIARPKMTVYRMEHRGARGGKRSSDGGWDVRAWHREGHGIPGFRFTGAIRLRLSRAPPSASPWNWLRPEKAGSGAMQSPGPRSSARSRGD